MAGGDKSKGKQVAKNQKEHYGDILEFILTHFPDPPLQKCFHDRFIIRSILTSYFINFEIY